MNRIELRTTKPDDLMLGKEHKVPLCATYLFIEWKVLHVDRAGAVDHGGNDPRDIAV